MNDDSFLRPSIDWQIPTMMLMIMAGVLIVLHQTGTTSRQSHSRDAGASASQPGCCCFSHGHGHYSGRAAFVTLSFCGPRRAIPMRDAASLWWRVFWVLAFLAQRRMRTAVCESVFIRHFRAGRAGVWAGDTFSHSHTTMYCHKICHCINKTRSTNGRNGRVRACI